MIRTPIAFPNHAPLTRTIAASLVQTAARYESRIMIHCRQKVVNAKSMLGLLSLDADDQNDLVLVAEGPDEAAAVEAINALL